MKSVLVTGGTVRIGAAIAAHLRRTGWRVIVSSHRPDAGADVVADLADPMGPARLYAGVLRLLGGEPPDALVNNAALFSGDAERLEAVNVTAPGKLTIMMAGRETGRGAVVNVLDAVPRETPYGRTKRALEDLTRKDAARFAETLRVNGAALGPVLAPVGVRETAPETPLGRPTPEAVAEAVEFLLSAPFTTGAILPVSGCPIMV